MTDFEAHPYAESFPMMDDSSAEWRGLVEDIKTNGLNHPIVLLDNRILDGRNREKACREAGIEPKYVEFSRAEKKTNDALTFVVSENLHRRHLTATQIVWSVSKIEPIWSEIQQRAKESREAGNSKGGRAKANDSAQSGKSSAMLHSTSSEQLAVRTGVSKRTAAAVVAVRNARDAGKVDPKVIAAMERKTKPLSAEAARALVTQPKDIQRSILASVTKDHPRGEVEIPVAKVKKAVAEHRRSIQRADAIKEAESTPRGVLDFRLGDWRTALDGVMCHCLIVDPPYSKRTHDATTTRADASDATGLTPGYSGWSDQDVHDFVASWSGRVDGWMVALTDSELLPAWRDAYRAAGRYAFAPVPCVWRGMSVRVSGDGPSSWAVYAMVARPMERKHATGGTLPGAYVDVYEGGASGEASGGRGKPEWLMNALVRDYSKPGNIVCDPMAGWGSTLVAARRAGRRIVGGEIDRSAYGETLARLRDMEQSSGQ